MPIYEYLCTKCKNEEEIIKSIKDDTEEICLKCGAVMERQISLSSFDIRGYAPGKALKSQKQLAKHNEKHKQNKNKK